MSLVPTPHESNGHGAAPAGRTTLLEKAVASRPVRRVFRYPVVERVMLPTRGDRSVHRFIRYSMVSGVAVVISQVTILICAGLLHFSGILANTVGALAATPASYELNRRWAWGKRGKSHLWKEVVPFWSLTVVGYLASTGTVQVADSLSSSHHVVGIDRALAIMGASLFAYGVVWVAKFVIFNKLVFAGGPARRFALPLAVDEDDGPAPVPALDGPGRHAP
jgi:putative flippase GtrA